MLNSMMSLSHSSSRVDAVGPSTVVTTTQKVSVAINRDRMLRHWAAVSVGLFACKGKIMSSLCGQGLQIRSNTVPRICFDTRDSTYTAISLPITPSIWPPTPEIAYRSLTPPPLPLA